MVLEVKNYLKEKLKEKEKDKEKKKLEPFVIFQQNYLLNKQVSFIYIYIYFLISINNNYYFNRTFTWCFFYLRTTKFIKCI